MRLHRFFTDADFSRAATDTAVVVHDAPLAHQIKNVLRARAGDPIELFDRRGFQITGTLESIVKETITVLVSVYTKPATEQKKVILYLAMLKRENFELAVQKATETGVSAIVPLITARTIKTGWKRERVEKIAIEASEQSGRRTIPMISEPISFTDAVAAKHGTKLFLDFNGTAFDRAMIEKKNTIALFVGPEGGWTDEERKMADTAGCMKTTIGPRTLRAETAAIIGSYLAAH